MVMIYYFLFYILFILFIQGVVDRCGKKSENYFCHILFILILLFYRIEKCPRMK